MVTTEPTTRATGSPTARSGTPQASLIATLIIATANARARWAEIDELYEHAEAQLSGELLEQMPSQYTTDFAQSLWLKAQLHQNPKFEQLNEQRLAAFRDWCLQQGQVEANKTALTEHLVGAFDGTGPSVFAGMFGTGDNGPSTVSSMDKPGGTAGGGGLFRASH